MALPPMGCSSKLSSKPCRWLTTSRSLTSHSRDLRPDAVAGEQNDAVLSHGGPERQEQTAETTEGSPV